jgi:DNA-binding CsgD family transcriptional regulator
MGNRSDRLTAGIRPILDKTLENALAHRIAREFPRMGGPRICQLCAQMILEVVNNYVRPKDSVRHGQVVWAAVDKDHRPGRYQRIAETDLVSVVLDVSTADDIHARIDRVPDYERKLNRALRLCRQAYEQGGLLTCFDLSEITGLSDSYIAHLLACYERENKKLVPRRGTLHDAGGGLSHKGIICYKRYVEGKSPEQVAQETYHSLTAVDRYLGQFDRVRHCRQQGLTPMETAHILNCTLRLVETYLQLDRELEGKDG